MVSAATGSASGFREAHKGIEVELDVPFPPLNRKVMGDTPGELHNINVPSHSGKFWCPHLGSAVDR